MQVAFQYDNAKYFGDILKLLDVFRDEIHFKVNSKGIFIRELDTWHVMLLSLEIPKHCFLAFKASKEEMFCVSIKDLKKIFRNTSKNDLLTWKILDKKLEVRFQGQIDRTFTVPLLDTPYEDYPEPNVDYNSQLTVDLTDFLKALNDAHGESISIIIDKENNVKITSEEEIKYTVNLTPNLIDFQKKKKPEKYSIFSTYKKEYLIKFLKPLKPLARNITIHLSSDRPLKITCKFINEEKLTYWLAPYEE